MPSPVRTQLDAIEIARQLIAEEHVLVTSREPTVTDWTSHWTIGFEYGKAGLDPAEILIDVDKKRVKLRSFRACKHLGYPICRSLTIIRFVG